MSNVLIAYTKIYEGGMQQGARKRELIRGTPELAQFYHDAERSRMIFVTAGDPYRVVAVVVE